MALNILQPSWKTGRSIGKFLPLQNLLLSKGCSSAFKPYTKIPKTFRLPFVGSLPTYMCYGGHPQLLRYVDAMHKKLGPIFIETTYQGTEMVFLADAKENMEMYKSEGEYPSHFLPEAWTMYLKDTGRERGIYFMYGEEWKKNRQILNKVLATPGILDGYYNSLSCVADDVVDLLKIHSDTEDIEYMLYCWNIEALCMAILGKRINFMNELPFKRSYSKLTNLADAVYNLFIVGTPLMTVPPTLAKKYDLKIWQRFHESTTTALELGQKYVKEAMKYSEGSKDNPNILNALKNHKMDEKNITKILIDLLLAGAYTSSQAALWTVYLLGRHPLVKRRVRDEMLEVLGNNSTPLTKEYYSNLPYLNAVLKENLRMYPTVPFLSRISDRPLSLCGYHIPEKSLIVSSLYTMARNEEYFSYPNEFLPERWLEGKKKEEAMKNFIDPYPFKNHYPDANIPWAVGARNCVGKQLAKMEYSILFSKLLLNFDWFVKEDRNVVLRMIPVPDKPLKISFKPLDLGRF